MRIPGFTAEVLPYKSSMPYRFAANQADLIGEQTVLPQQLYSRWCWAVTLCVGGWWRVCCTGWLPWDISCNWQVCYQ